MPSLSSSAVPDESGHFFGNGTALPTLATGQYPRGGGPVRRGCGFRGQRFHARKAMMTACRVQEPVEEKSTSVVENFKQHI